MARPTELTPDVHRKIVEAVRNGNFRETAAMAAGVTARTMRSWLARGARGEQPFADFADDVEQAEAQSEMDDIAVVAAAASGDRGDWKAIAWRRERMSSRWQLRLRVELTKELDALLDALEVEFAKEPHVVERILSVAAGSLGGGPARAPRGDGSDESS